MSVAQGSGRARAIWLVVFWAAVGIGAYVVGVQSAVGQRAEDSVLGAADFTTSPPPPLNLVSIPSVAIALVGVGVIALITHGIRRALVVTIAPAIAVVASQLLKLRLLTRPELFELDAANTFPSGHMTVFTALTAALIWSVPTKLRSVVALGGAALLAAVGWQLLAYGWHRPSDVLGGIALGTIVFAAAAVLRPVRSKGSAILGRTTSLGLLTVGVLLVIAALGTAVLAAYRSSADYMLLAGQVGCIAAALLSARSLFTLSASK